MTEVWMTFDMALTVAVDVETGKLRFEAGDVGDPSAPTLIELEGHIAVTEVPLDAEGKEVVTDPRVERAFELLAGPGPDPAWDWAEGVAEAANEGLTGFVTRRA
jgi:hypothetical protein